MVAIEKHDIQSALNLVFSRVNTSEKHPPSGDTALHTAVRAWRLDVSQVVTCLPG